MRELVPGKDPNVEYTSLLTLHLCFTLTRSLSIVAVHGLNPTNAESHAYTTWVSGDKLWLEHFLPEALPRARILIFGYNANVTVDSSTTGVREQAENLLNWLGFESQRKVLRIPSGFSEHKTDRCI